jgi:hypothetical protein
MSVDVNQKDLTDEHVGVFQFICSSMKYRTKRNEGSFQMLDVFDWYIMRENSLLARDIQHLKKT